MADEEKKTASLENVKDVVFQALLLDDVEQDGNGLSASLYTIYSLN